MSSIRPPTRSPGFLSLPYVAFGAEHRLAVRFSHTYDTSNTGLSASIANGLAPLVAACMPPTQALNRFEVYDAANSFLYGASLSASYAGTHSTGALPNYHSQTLAINGKGIAGAPGYAVGQTKFVFRVGNAYLFQPGTKRQVFDAALTNLANFLAVRPEVWCDFFGQKSIVRAGAAIQWNAHIQRVEGA